MRLIGFDERVLQLSDDLKLAHHASVTNTEHQLTIDRLRKEMDVELES